MCRLRAERRQGGLTAPPTFLALADECSKDRRGLVCCDAAMSDVAQTRSLGEVLARSTQATTAGIRVWGVAPLWPTNSGPIWGDRALMSVSAVHATPRRTTHDRPSLRPAEIDELRCRGAPQWFVARAIQRPDASSRCNLSRRPTGRARTFSELLWAVAETLPAPQPRRGPIPCSFRRAPLPSRVKCFPIRSLNT